jgi:D-alanyl-D-alanine dipeptidase
MKFPSSSRQALVVTVDSASSARLTRLGRESAFQPWREVGEAIPVTIGWNGLASGQGRLPGLEPKREGDGKTPAGTYPIERAFGRAESFPTQLPYLAISPTTEAVDDPASPLYNQIVDSRDFAPGAWKSSEKMLRADHVYDLGLVVGYNTRPAVPGRGSCIFLHIWKSPGSTTAGCIAMSREDLAEIVRWLTPAARPVLSVRQK